MGDYYYILLSDSDWQVGHQNDIAGNDTCYLWVFKVAFPL